MKRLLLSALVYCCGCGAADDPTPVAVKTPGQFQAAVGVPTSGRFQAPVRLTADGVAVRVESPGYAAPCWTDMDGDGQKDLLVGQFNQGKIRVFKNLGAEKLAAGDWLLAEGKLAEVPGVW